MKILSLPVDTGGCGYYRIRQPLDFVKRLGHETHVIDPKDDDMVSVAEAINMADVILCRGGSEQGIKKLITDYPEYKDKKWVMDIDDNFLEISPYSPHYGDFGDKEFYDKNSKVWIWKDGESIDIKRNKERRDWHEWGLRNSHMVTVTTEILAKYARKYNKNVEILPNLINMDSWWRLDTKKHRQLRVGWSGGASHYEDWYSIKEPLNELMRKYQFTLVMVGSNFSGVIDEDNKHLVELHDSWIPFLGHSYRMMSLDLDIAIIPLAETPFNSFKSSLKWYEMSAMEVPSIVSWVPPYSVDVPEGLCYRYKDPQSFTEAFLEALESDDKRKSLGKEARKWVNDNRNAEKSAGLWVEAFKKII